VQVNFSRDAAVEKAREDDEGPPNLEVKMEVLPMETDRSPSLLLIVPRGDAEASRRLQHTLAGTGIRIIVDRRSTERARTHLERVDDRRARAERQSALARGRWIVIPVHVGDLDLFDADARAIRFLYCAQHSVPCESCQDTYRLGWLGRADTALTCPRCGDDLTPVIVAHTLGCENWALRRRQKSLARIVGHATVDRLRRDSA